MTEFLLAAVVIPFLGAALTLVAPMRWARIHLCFVGVPVVRRRRGVLVLYWTAGRQGFSRARLDRRRRHDLGRDGRRPQRAGRLRGRHGRRAHLPLFGRLHDAREQGAPRRRPAPVLLLHAGLRRGDGGPRVLLDDHRRTVLLRAHGPLLLGPDRLLREGEGARGRADRAHPHPPFVARPLLRRGGPVRRDGKLLARQRSATSRAGRRPPSCSAS